MGLLKIRNWNVTSDGIQDTGINKAGIFFLRGGGGDVDGEGA